MPATLAEARPLIEAALMRGYNTHGFEDVEAMVAEGRLQFWPGANSVILTEILDHPRRRVLNVFAAGGKLAEIEAMIPPLQAWAVEKGCTLAIFAGRAGWVRTFLSRTGWVGRVWMAKEL